MKHFVGLGFGLWGWPLLNRLLEVTQGLKTPGSILRPTVANTEEWEIVRDNSGRLKTIRVHREVKE